MDVDTSLDNFSQDQLRLLLSPSKSISAPSSASSSDYEDNAHSKEDRFQTLADLGFSSSDEDAEVSDNNSDEEFNFRNALREVRNFKVKSNKDKPRKGGLAALRRKIRRTDMDPEVKIILGQANEAFVKNDLDTALKHYSEVIKMDKNNFSAYKTLGEIYRLKGDLNKCSNIWLLAAHINSWDIEFWKTVAELSVELGHHKQAIYCYRRAITSSNGKDWDAIFSRACLYREVGKFKRATDGLLRLRSALPTESKVVRELAKVYVEEGRINDAISLYTQILDENVQYRKMIERGENVELDNITFDWSELNILSELYSTKAAWSLGIKSLRQISRWIQGRETQTFWDDNMANDIEFDERKLDHPRWIKLDEEKDKDYSLPIDIRIQLGIFRLNNKEEEEALNHFRILLDQDIQETPDLYYKVGMELESFALYDEALEFLVPLSYFEEHNTSELVVAVAKCLRETEDFGNARDAYDRLLKVDPNNVELMVALAECCFYLGDIHEADRLYKEAKVQRKKEKATARDNLISTSSHFNISKSQAPESLDEMNIGDDDINMNRYDNVNDEDDEDEYVDADDEDDEDDEDELFHPQAIIEDEPERKRKKRKRPVFTPSELHTMEVKSELRVKKQYERCFKIFQQIEAEGGEHGKRFKNPKIRTMANVWIEMVSDLVEIFSMYRWFFASERAKKFNIKLRQRTTKLSIDHKLSRMRYLQNEVTLSQQFYSQEHPKEIFKGLTYDQWYDLFINYSLMIAEFEKDAEGAITIQDITRQIVVFKNHELSTQLVGLSIAILAKDDLLILNQSRQFMNDYQFALDSFRLYLSACQPSLVMEEYFADPPSQKFLLRQIKAFDSIREAPLKNHTSHTLGKAAITKTNVSTETPHFFTNYVYASYLFTNRSYYSAIVYLIKLYKHFDDNPELLFLLALSNLYRSVQRKTLNTSFQILQGFTYLQEWMQAKEKAAKGKGRKLDGYDHMENYYNIGRAFHMLGLDHLAVSLYEKCLQVGENMQVDKRWDLRKEAAHNLICIYSGSGNWEESEKLMEKYLVI
ncbi:transcription factor TFIIIC subunit [Martiniozyma asiatica (nom. inval.)]|nr:transcription factor TFIIIC subunit [Martiniozyma asiatica]